MATATYSKEEIISLLKRSNLKTVIVEGIDDIGVLRDIESRIKTKYGNVDFLPAGNKDMVLKIWEHNSEFVKSSVGYLVDSDLWLFNTECLKFNEVIFTKGYSIENICIQFNDLSNLVTTRHSTEASWNTALAGLTKWFAAEVAYFLNDENPILDINIGKILALSNDFILTDDALTRISNAPSDKLEQVKSLISKNPLYYIRGKQLFLALKEVIQKSENVNHSVKSLKSLGAKLPNPAVDALIFDIATALGLNEPTCL